MSVQFNIKRILTKSFTEYQVHSFRLPTPDGEELYGWHVLPLGFYATHEAQLAEAAKTNSSHELAIQLLKDDPESRVIINCKLYLAIL
jgi:abhydrolase domain-containing protein 12